MRILLTGAAGFVGSHVLRDLLAKDDNFEIVCLIRLENTGDLNRIADLQGHPRVKFVYHDLRYSIHGEIARQIGGVEAMLHLAANSHVDRSIANPKEFFVDNVMGTVNLLEFLRLQNPFARFINFATDEVFGAAAGDYKFKEDDRFRPSNPYSGSKAGQVMAGVSYCTTYKLDIITTYTMNIFGAGQTPEKLIPKAIRSAKERTPMPVFAELGEDGQMKSVGSRHWLHVSNIASALSFLLSRGVSGEHYNIVGTDELTNEDVVRTVNKLLGFEPLIEYVDFHKTRPGHDRRYAIDGAKLAELGWVPTMNFEEGIKDVIEQEK